MVVNPAPERGQGSSLRSGLERLSSAARGFLIYPVDHPLVTGADLARLIEAYVDAGNLSDGEPPHVVAPSFNHRRGHPVLVSARLVPALLALTADQSPREVLAAPTVRTAYVDFDDDRVLRDMDTPEAYAECLRRYSHSSAP